MALVALSIAMLLAAPLLAAALLRRPALAAGLDGFVLVAVGGIVALHVVPQSAELAGPAAVGAAALGLFLPIALHRLDDSVQAAARSAAGVRRVRDAVLFVVFLSGVVVHALFDGAALSPAANDESIGPLALGVILHRVPVGLALWVVARPKIGSARTLAVVVTYAGGTVLGSLIGPALLAHASAPALAIFQAFVAGSILHIVAESPALPLPRARPTPFLAPPSSTTAKLRAAAPSNTVRAAGLVGSGLAVAALWLMERGHADAAHAGSPEFADRLLSLALLTAPAALLSFVVVGVLFAIYPEHAPLRARGPRVVDAVRGTLAGLPHPLCSCAVAPLYEELVDARSSPASARAFLVAAPALGVPALFLSARLLGLPFTAVRVLGAALLALAAGLTARAAATSTGSAASTSPDDEPSAIASAPSSPVPFMRRLVHGLRHGVVDAVDHVGPWLLLGVAVAAAVDVALAPAALAAAPAPLQIGLAAVASLPLYLCAAGLTPVAFVLLGKGASAGAVLALLLVGPTTSLPTLGLVRRHHGTAAAVVLAVAVVVAACAFGLAVDELPVAPVALVAGPVTLVQMGSLFALSALLAASFVRQGVRGFLVQVMSPQHVHEGDDVHGPNCAHDHGPALAPPVARITLPFDPRGRS